jgi:hypothetical protein
MSSEIKNKIAENGLKDIARSVFIWGIVISLVLSPIFVYLI